MYPCYRVPAKREGNLYYLRREEVFDHAKIGLTTNKSVAKSIDVWHRWLGHRTLDQQAIQFLQPRVSEFEIQSSKIGATVGEVCGTCAIGCQHREAIIGTKEKAVALLDVVHSDICGPMQVSMITGERYFITFIDEPSGRVAVTLLKTKSEALGAFHAYKMRAEKEAGRGIRALKTDGRGEYLNNEFKSYLQGWGIGHKISPPYTPAHNGLGERTNQTLMESARSMIADAQLDKAFWGFAVVTAAHIHNRLPSRSHESKSPLHHWTGRPASIGHLRVFGSVTYALIPAAKRKKMDSHSAKCILLGYDEDAGSKVYQIYDLASKRVFCSRDVIINETGTSTEGRDEGTMVEEIEIGLPEVREKEMWQDTVETATKDTTRIPPTTNVPDEEGFGGDTIIVRPPGKVAETRGRPVSVVGPRRSERQRNTSQYTSSRISSNTMRAMVANLEEPQSLNEALGREDGEQWYEAWESEVDSLVRNDTWELASLPAAREAIGCRWLFKRKEDGRYKARLVANGYSQKARVDYTETFAPVAKFNSLRTLLALVCENDWELEGMDVKTAFLHSELEETVFMEIPDGLHSEISSSEKSGEA